MKTLYKALALATCLYMALSAGLDSIEQQAQQASVDKHKLYADTVDNHTK